MAFSWSSFEALISMFAPAIIAAVVPNGALIGPLVASAITTVETLMGAGTGPAKKAAVLSTVSQAVTALNTAQGKVILDPAVTANQVGTGIDLAIGVINDIQAAQGKAAPPTS